MKLVSFDVETNKMLEPGFAVGAVALDHRHISGFYGVVHCPDPNDWVAKNVMPLLAEASAQCRYTNNAALYRAFWQWLQENREEAIIVADVPYPVETTFLRAVQEEVGSPFGGPYPLVDLASILLVLGIDPDTEREKLLGQQALTVACKHHPSWDALVSGILALAALKGRPQGAYFSLPAIGWCIKCGVQPLLVSPAQAGEGEGLKILQTCALCKGKTLPLDIRRYGENCLIYK